MAKAAARTAATGAYSDPATVGAMIQKMYPQYATFDPATLGQRWIAVHAPAPATGAMGIGETGLQPPTGTTPLTTTNPTANTPDLSGLSKFATPFQQPKPVMGPKVNLSHVAAQGNQLTQQPQSNSPWLGSQIVSGIANMFKAPKLQAEPLSNLGY